MFAILGQKKTENKLEGKKNKMAEVSRFCRPDYSFEPETKIKQDSQRVQAQLKRNEFKLILNREQFKQQR